MADAVFTIDLKGNLTFLSPETGKMTGYSIEQLLSMNIKELIAPEDLPEVLKRLETRSRGVSGLLPMQFELVRADGTRFPIEVHTNLLCEGNKPVGVQGVARDITERKRMEDALRNSEARFREMANLLPQIVFEIDSKGNYTFVNRSGIASVGYTEEEILSGLNALQTFIEPDRARIKKNIGRALAGEELATTEYTALRKDGTTFPVIIHSTPIIHEGKPVGLRGIAMDITERKRMEEALRESERRFREMTDMLPETVLEQDLNGNYTFMNPAGLKAIGYDEGDLKKGLNAFQVVAPEDHDALREGIRRILNGAPSKGQELTIVRKDGSRFPEIAYASPIIKEGKPVGLRGVVVDITERKRLEERLAEAKRFAAIGETAAMVGHDLRNPLQAISGALQLLKQESLAAEERNEMLQVIEKSAHYADAIVKDLSDYAAEIKLKLAEATPKSITRDAIEAIEVPQNVTIQDLSEDNPTLSVDPDKMRRVFVNLIENAIDAMPQGGTLTVSSKKSDGNVRIPRQFAHSDSQHSNIF
jgi:PAS domain S-box-containing protein